MSNKINSNCKEEVRLKYRKQKKVNRQSVHPKAAAITKTILELGYKFKTINQKSTSPLPAKKISSFKLLSNPLQQKN